MKRILLATAAVAAIGAVALSGTAVFADPGHGTAQGTGAHHMAGAGPSAGMGASMMMGTAAGPTMMRGQGMGMMGPSGFDAALANVVEKKLEITAAQQPAWRAYVDALAKGAGTMQSMRDSMQGVHDLEASIDERLALMDDMHAAGREAFETVESARVQLYEVLTEEQQQEAKALLPGAIMGSPMGAATMMAPCHSSSEGACGSET